MKLPVVHRSELALAHSEREEWRRRAEAGFEAERAVSGRRSASRARIRRRGRMVATAALALGAAAAVVTLPGRSGGAAQPDYSSCIGQARYADPISGNQYQELVNALYACGIYETASGGG